MVEKWSRISLDPDGDDFTLRLTTASGDDTVISLSADNVLALAQAAPGYRQYIMSRRRPGALFVTPVLQPNAAWDSLGENILLEMKFAPSGNVIFEVSPENCRYMVVGLQKLLDDGPSSQLTRQ